KSLIYGLARLYRNESLVKYGGQDYSDWCVIDFDPDTNPFNQVIEAAVVTHRNLLSAGIDSYCKTSGSTGIHIYIP
ncbi:MAG TPA: DNA ligase D, partial [Puia sp.]